ncbi:MAG TPA: CBS domain-containing protein, partial [Terriglobales bacterium]|nr:CBS domain-containing protein [Terriglobales bacterium]
MERIVDLVKDRDVYYVETSQSVLDTARFMSEKNIGAVAVVRGDELVGIFSERDLMKRVVAVGKDPAATT